MAINHVWKTVIALFMCVLTLFAFGLKLAVEAHAFAISAGVIGLIAVVLGSFGIVFATNTELQRVCEQYYSDASSSIKSAFDTAAALVDDGIIKWNDLNTVFGLGVMSSIISSMSSYFDQGVAYTTINGINDFQHINRSDSNGYVLPFLASLTSYPSYYNTQFGRSCWDLFTLNGQIVRAVDFSAGSSSEVFRLQTAIYRGTTRIVDVVSPYYRKEAGKYTFDTSNISVAPCIKVVNGIKYLCIVWGMLCSDGITRYYSSDQAVLGLNLNDLGTTTTYDWYGQAGAIDDGIIGQAWDTALEQEYEDTDVITLTDSIPWAASQTSDVIDVGYTQSDVLTDVGINDIVQDITSEIDMDYPISIDDYKVPPAWVNPSDGKTIRFADIFPFCIPFDIYDFLSLLSATRTAPHFEIPFNYDRIGLDYTFVLDFSGESWENLAQIVRTLELLAFCVGLAFVTRDMIKG